MSADEPLIWKPTRAGWPAPEEIRKTADRHRTPLVLYCFEDDLAGRRYPLNRLIHCCSA